MPLFTSRPVVNRKLAWSKGDTKIARMEFPFGWDSQAGAIFNWYFRQPCKRFVSVQHRKDHTAPFYHHFLVFRLVDGTLCRFERVSDPDARLEALDQRGSLAHDLVETFSPSHRSALDQTSDVLVDILFPREMDLMDVLAVCYSIQQLEQTRFCTLQTYNCYFFCWCVLLVLTRRVSGWDDYSKDWHELVRQFIARTSSNLLLTSSADTIDPCELSPAQCSDIPDLEYLVSRHSSRNTLEVSALRLLMHGLCSEDVYPFQRYFQKLHAALLAPGLVSLIQREVRQALWFSGDMGINELFARQVGSISVEVMISMVEETGENCYYNSIYDFVSDLVSESCDAQPQSPGSDETLCQADEQLPYTPSTIAPSTIQTRGRFWNRFSNIIPSAIRRHNTTQSTSVIRYFFKRVLSHPTTG